MEGVDEMAILAQEHFVKRLPPVITFLVFALAGHACRREQEPPPRPEPPKLRSRACAIDGWLPTGSLELSRLNQAKQDTYVAFDNRTIAKHVEIPGDHGKLVCDLRIKLGKGLHRQTMTDYWPCIKRGLESIGIGATMGELRYEDERGVDRDDTRTMIELREVR